MTLGLPVYVKRIPLMSTIERIGSIKAKKRNLEEDQNRLTCVCCVI
jgi:hypothetical protein